VVVGSIRITVIVVIICTRVIRLCVQNIFLGEDIRRQLPLEAAAFDDINNKWKTIMTHLHKVKNVYRGTHQPGSNVGN